MGLDEPALFDDDETLLQQALGHKVDLDELRRVGWVQRAVPGGRPGVGRRRVPDRRRARSSSSASSWRRWASRRCRRSSPPREGPHGDPDLLGPLPAAAADAEAPRPVPQLGLLAAAQARPGRGRAVRRARRRRRRGAGPRRRRPGPGVERPGQRRRCRCRSPTGCAPASSRIPFGWWSAHHPDGRAANALTNDTLTEWGGGVAFSDTLVEVEQA